MPQAMPKKNYSQEVIQNLRAFGFRIKVNICLPYLVIAATLFMANWTAVFGLDLIMLDDLKLYSQALKNQVHVSGIIKNDPISRFIHVPLYNMIATSPVAARLIILLCFMLPVSF